MASSLLRFTPDARPEMNPSASGLSMAVKTTMGANVHVIFPVFVTNGCYGALTEFGSNPTGVPERTLIRSMATTTQV